MNAPKADVKLIDFHGEAYYTVFIDGEEMTGASCGRLPVKQREDAWAVAEELLNDMDVVEAWAVAEELLNDMDVVEDCG